MNNENMILKQKGELEGKTLVVSNSEVPIIENLDRAPTAENEDVEITEEELEQFYEENQDAIDLIGGLDAFESMMTLDDEQFEVLKPSLLEMFTDTLSDPVAVQELYNLVIARNYNRELLTSEFQIAIEAIDTIDFLSETKKDFLKEIYMASMNKVSQLLNESVKVITIPCELEEGIQTPIYAHETDAGLDIYAKEEITINPGETKIIGTGIKMAIPEGYAILIQPRSGQSAKTKLRIANTPGLIDAGYRDEIGVIIENIEPPFKDIDYEFDNNGEIHIKSILHGEAYTITEGQRFAQMRLVEVPKANFVQVDSVSEIGEDRNGGFGSTGLQ